MNTGKITYLIRRLGLMHLLDLLRFRIQQVRRFNSNRTFVRRHPEVALPPDYLMYESFQLHYQKYYEGGREVAGWIVAQLTPHLPFDQTRLLDWGCGPGRVIRHLPSIIKEPGVSFYGTDYNARSIDWCQKNLPGIHFSQNQLAPPLGYENDFFDAIYGISIFTHLSEESHRQWMQELLRVTKPGGLLLLTTHGDAYKVKLTGEEQQRYAQGQLIERSQAIEGHRVFTAFQPPVYFRQLVAPYADIIAHTPGKPQSWGIEQDVWLIKKHVK